MADSRRIHPSSISKSTPPADDHATTFHQPIKAPDLPPSKPVPPPPPATYVVQLPRDQILRYPPPENARKFHKLIKADRRRGCCRRCCCFLFCFLLLLIVAAAISAGVLYLVFRFKSPNYQLTSLVVRGMNLTSPAPLSPEFDVTIRAENPNGKQVGIYYLKGSSVRVLYDGVSLSEGLLPVFFQPRNNVTEMKTALKASGVVLGGNLLTALRKAESGGRVPLVVTTKAPVKVKVGSLKTWKFTVKVKCDVVLNALTDKAKIVSHDCNFDVRLW